MSFRAQREIWPYLSLVFEMTPSFVVDAATLGYPSLSGLRVGSSTSVFGQEGQLLGGDSWQALLFDSGNPQESPPISHCFSDGETADCWLPLPGVGMIEYKLAAVLRVRYPFWDLSTKL